MGFKNVLFLNELIIQSNMSLWLVNSQNDTDLFLKNRMYAGVYDTISKIGFEL